jgi:hypothetical protein
LHKDYFVGLSSTERRMLAEWLRQTASVALAPRFIAASSHEIHADFKWLLDNRSDQVLAILRQHWTIYREIITPKARDTLANHDVDKSKKLYLEIQSRAFSPSEKDRIK